MREKTLSILTTGGRIPEHGGGVTSFVLKTCRLEGVLRGERPATGRPAVSP